MRSTASATGSCASRSTARASTRPPRRSRPSRRCSRRSSPRRSRSTSASASTCATPTSRCAARWCCRTASAGTSSVAVFAQGDKAREAEAAGADAVGGEDLAERVQRRLDRLRRGDRDARHDAGGRQARAGPRPAGQDAEPQGRHRHRGRRPRGRAGQGRPGRVPHRPHRDRPPRDRPGRLRRAPAARELRRADRRDRARQAGRREGPLHPLGHAHDDDGPRRPRRPDQDARPARRRQPQLPSARASTIARPRQRDACAPKTAGSREAEVRSRRRKRRRQSVFLPACVRAFFGPIEP